MTSFIAPGVTTTMKLYSVCVHIHIAGNFLIVNTSWLSCDKLVFRNNENKTGDDGVQVYENQLHGIRVPASSTWSKNKDWGEMMD